MTNSDIDLVDPELRPLLATLPPVKLNAESFSLRRAELDQQWNPGKGVPLDGVLRHETHVPGPNGAPDIRVVIHRRADAPPELPVVLDVHGGGMTMGSPEINNPRNAAIALHHNCAVVSPAYRRAPETPGPGAAEDCYAVLQWLSSGTAREVGLDPNRIIVSGGSGGGGIAAALALIARDRGNRSISALMLMSPMLDDRTGQKTAARGPYGAFVWPAEANECCWEAVKGGVNEDEMSPYVSPARAQDLGGLPPTFISVGQLDLFFHESLEYAGRLSDARVPIELHVYPRAYHGMAMMVPASRVAQAHDADYQAYLERACRGEL